MKKILCSLWAVVACFLLVSCSSKPTDVVENYLDDLQTGRYTEIPNLMYASQRELTEKDREEIVSLYETKIAKKIEVKEGIQSYRIDSEQMGDDGETATVSYTIVYGNGDSETQNTSVVKVNGEWKLSVDK